MAGSSWEIVHVTIKGRGGGATLWFLISTSTSLFCRGRGGKPLLARRSPRRTPRRSSLSGLRWSGKGWWNGPLLEYDPPPRPPNRPVRFSSLPDMNVILRDEEDLESHSEQDTV